MIPEVVHVVIPAHDEEERIGACLDSVTAAMAAARRALPRLVLRASVVLDRCTDATAALVAASGVGSIEVDAACVGVARHAGVRHVAEQAPPASADHVWVAMTDADCVVPESWLLDHVRTADVAQLVVGRVLPDLTELSAPASAEWSSRHPVSDLHVHGANLGFRLDAYQRVGGFAPLAEHEDVVLVAALMESGVRTAQASWVVTSARHDGRTPGGFAGYIADLEAEVAG